MMVWAYTFYDHSRVPYGVLCPDIIFLSLVCGYYVAKNFSIFYSVLSKNQFIKLPIMFLDYPEGLLKSVNCLFEILFNSIYVR